MKLGVPTLCRYDLLEALLWSAERGSLKPSGYIIIDNGGTYDAGAPHTYAPTWMKTATERGATVDIVRPGRNLGVAASWNRILDMVVDFAVVISNDDIVLGEKHFAELAALIEHVPFAEGLGWALFAQSPECTRRVGYYDENFAMAYYEDVDYCRRMELAGIEPVLALSTPVEHTGWATTRALGAEHAERLTACRERNRAYFIQKWGGETTSPRWNGVGRPPIWTEPFNGYPPEGWTLRSPRRTEAPMMRWDILNYIAKKIGARRYLEIGVSDGTCMRHIEVPEKWGVDPNPTPGGVRAADIFVGHRSDEFWGINGDRPFNLVFIDGDHRAEQVYREVKMALRVLSPGGVIVLHDCSPLTEAMQVVPAMPGDWCGDVWKAVVQLRVEGEHRVRVVDTDYGVGIVLPHRAPGPDAIKIHPGPLGELGWEHLSVARSELLGLVPEEHWQAWFDAASLENTA